MFVGRRGRKSDQVKHEGKTKDPTRDPGNDSGERGEKERICRVEAGIWAYLFDEDGPHRSCRDDHSRVHVDG